MKSNFFLVLVLGASFAFLRPAEAQSTPTIPLPGVDAATEVLTEGLKFRSDLAAGIQAKQITAALALVRLKANPAASGLSVAAEVDFAFAAIDLGQRLVAAGKTVDAELFFKEAELSLAATIQRTPDTAAPEKALYLRKLALIRGRYLNEVPQAKIDLERAIALQPEDASLQKTKELLARTNAEHFKAQAPQPPR